MRKTRPLATAFACGLALLLAQGAHGAQLVKLDARFNPDKLSVPTTIEFGFHVSSSTPGAVPSPVIGVDLYLPAGMGLATSTLGLAVCQPKTLLELGLRGCPANARVGFGRAVGELRAGGEVIREAATVQAVLGPNLNNHEQILFYVESIAPVQTELVFPSELLPSSSPAFSGHLDTSVPVVSAWTDGPDVSVTQLNSTLGPLGLTYYRHVHGNIVSFRPRGISVPPRCPKEGFPFRANMAFLDGSRVTASTAVRCPSGRQNGVANTAYKTGGSASASAAKT